MNEQEQEKFEGHAIVELMGRSMIAGYVSEQVIAGCVMLRVDVPATDEASAFTKFFGGGAIFGITPATEEIALRAASRLSIRPVAHWIVPTYAYRPELVDGQADGGEPDRDDKYDPDF